MYKFLVVFSILVAVFVLVSAQPPAKAAAFVPADNFLIDCGGDAIIASPDGRVFKTDDQASSFLSATDSVRVSTPAAEASPSPLYLSARIFREEATYSFRLVSPGWHWIRLHFFPFENSNSVLTEATFSVVTGDYVLLHSFTADDPKKFVLKEYLFNATTDNLTLKFTPSKNSVAFVNGIEVVSAPNVLIGDEASSLSPVGPFDGLSKYGYETAHRVNVGGGMITSANDTLGRQWSTDDSFLQSRPMARTVTVSPTIVKYGSGISPLIAPSSVYASAVRMADANVVTPNFNISWNFDVDPSFAYLVRLHFCDIVSKTPNDLYFNVYINGMTVASPLDLSTINDGNLAAAYFKDVVVNPSIASDKIMVQVGPLRDDTRTIDAILNGVEILKMSNSVKSLDGEFGVDGKKADEGTGKSKGIAMVGIAMGFGALAGVAAMTVKWYKRPQDWRRRNSFSSWLLPVHTNQSSFTNSKGSTYGSHKSGLTFSSTLGLGRYFSFAELQSATKNWDQNAVVGVGGFGNVYLAEIDDGTKIAVKRGNPQSEQGITEFQTEIQMLSKLRHRHLVSLIGYCDENSEMILVYEYMANGPFRDHIYGKDLPALSWKQRLEICIGAARGLCTGTAQGIIHRDVKTTNILLDENFVAKVSDFGLSKDAPGMNQTHVSTAVKGSFGYLDPEYFRRQQLTDKSDVYSFGVVLLETLCARPALDPALPREQVNLAEWAMQWKRKGLMQKIIDPKLVGTINEESLNKFVEAAEKCLAEYGVDRPSMGDVLWNLEYALQLQEANPPTPPPQVKKSSDDDDDEDKETAVASDKSNDVYPSIPENSSTAVANELFAQFAGMKGR